MPRWRSFSLVLVAIFLFVTAQSKVFAAINIDSISPSTVTSLDQIISLSVSATGLDNKTQYLQVGITNPTKANYFGYTLNAAKEWYKYESSPSDLATFFTFTPTGGAWSGQVQAKIDPADPGFGGSGNYNLKLFKYITSSPSYSNVVTVAVDIPTAPPPPPPAPSPTSSANSKQDSKPSIDFSPPGSVPVGTSFPLAVQAANLPEASYYIKVRIGPDENHLTHGQTSNSAWLDDNDPWSSFQTLTITGNSWQGNVTVRLPDTEAVGNYQILIRLKKTSTDTTYNSAAKGITFTKSITPPPPPPVSKSSPTPAPSASPLAAKLSTSPTLAASPNEHVLGESTSSSSSPVYLPLDSSTKIGERTDMKAINLKLNNTRRASFPVVEIVIAVGAILLAVSAFVFWRYRATTI